MRALQVISGVVLALLGAGLLYFRSVTFYWAQVGDCGKGGSTRSHPVAFAAAGTVCIAVAIVILLSVSSSKF